MIGKQQIVSQMLKMLQEAKGFKRVLSKVKILTAGAGSCTAEYKVEQESTNTLGTLHGGYSATLVDVISSFALYSKENCDLDSVSVNMNISYLKAAKLGEEIIIEAKTLRAGKTLAFLDVEIKNKSTGDLLVKGTHTKCFLRPK